VQQQDAKRKDKKARHLRLKSQALLEAASKVIASTPALASTPKTKSGKSGSSSNSGKASKPVTPGSDSKRVVWKPDAALQEVSRFSKTAAVSPAATAASTPGSDRAPAKSALRQEPKPFPFVAEALAAQAKNARKAEQARRLMKSQQALTRTIHSRR
jgi:hypothetical protein